MGKAHPAALLAAGGGACALLFGALATGSPAHADDPVAENPQVPVTVTVQIPDAGALGLTVSATTVDLGTASVDESVEAADRAWQASAALPSVVVEDTRITDPGWNLTAQMSGFAAADGTTPPGTELLLRPLAAEGTLLGLNLNPEVDLSPDDATDTEETGDPVIAWTDPGAGRGEAGVGGELDFRAPLTTDPGDYQAVITLTVS